MIIYRCDNCGTEENRKHIIEDDWTQDGDYNFCFQCTMDNRTSQSNYALAQFYSKYPGETRLSEAEKRVWELGYWDAKGWH